MEFLLEYCTFIVPILICVAFATLLERKVLAAIQLREAQILFFGMDFFNFCRCVKTNIQRRILPIASNMDYLLQDQQYF
jgi:NADH:ubiquinone oxidoreductase subunit H